MSDETLPPPRDPGFPPLPAVPPQQMPAEKPTTGKTLRWIAWGVTVAAVVLPWVLYLTGKGPQPDSPPIIPPIPQQVTGPSDDGPPPNSFGWVPDREAIAAADQTAVKFSATPAGQAVMGGEIPDTFLWRPVIQFGGRLGNVNQRDVGCCVGCGWKHASDASLAAAKRNGEIGEFRFMAVEPIYGGSRVEVGGGRISGDGSLGAWAAKSVSDRVGLLPMDRYDAADLREFSPQRAREWGRSGVPDALEPIARQHLAKGTAMVKSWTEAQKAVGQGYAVAVCSDQGFTMTRDGQGFARPQGQWPHCMALVGARGGQRPGGFILNSWGDSAHTGGRWPEDMPVAGFWADASVIDRMLSQGDSYAVSGITGFPARKLDWLVQRGVEIRPARERIDDTRPLFALAP